MNHIGIDGGVEVFDEGSLDSYGDCSISHRSVRDLEAAGHALVVQNHDETSARNEESLSDDVGDGASVEGMPLDGLVLLGAIPLVVHKEVALAATSWLMSSVKL